MRITRQKVIGGLIIALLLVFYFSFLFHKVNLVTADIGRHIVNGRELVENSQLIKTNFYSYTEPDFPVITHHWGSGAIFYLIWKIAGFAGVQMLFLGLSLITFLIFFWVAVKKSSLGIASLVAIPVIPLLAERTEIRPEVFSYLFAGIFLGLLWKYRRGGLRFRWLLWLPFIEILWVNTHIYFFLGPLIIAAFLLEDLLKRRIGIGKTSITILILTSLATLINPFGIAAVIKPFTILQEYGYRVLENQPVWFIEKLISNPNYLIFKIMFGLLAVSFIVLIFRAREKFSLSNILLAAGISIMAWLMTRNFCLFGLIALPIIATNLTEAFPQTRLRFKKMALGLLALAVVISVSGNLNVFFPYWHEFGLGLEKNNDGAAEFILQQKISGPILNNYDIGSYLIFYTFPTHRVFVDNRPEAYSLSFFQDIYIPLQENESKWQKLKEKFGFNAIVFSYHDATPWAQRFLIERVQDPEWAPVYVDQYILIFLKRSEQNLEIIKKFEIPRDYFQVINRT